MKVLIVSYHGLGDNILLTPVLRKYKEENPQNYVGFTHIRRLPVDDLLQNCPYIDEFFATSDAWNDFGNINEGIKVVMEEAVEYAKGNGYDEVVPITTSPDTGFVHKIHRAAHELGVVVNDYHTEMFPNITEDVKDKADKFLKKVHEPYIFLHLKTGNPPKDISPDVIGHFLEGVSPMQTIEYGSRSIPSHYLPLGNIPLEMEILSRCSQVVCADSFIMHAACSLGIPTKAIFIATPPEWVIPLHDVDLEIFKKI